MAIESKDDNVFRFLHLRGLSPRKNGQPHADDSDGNAGHTEDEERQGREVEPPIGERSDSTQETKITETRQVREAPRAGLLHRAVASKRELEALTPGIHLSLSTKSGDGSAVELLALTKHGSRRLSKSATDLLKLLDPATDLVGTPVTTLIETLDRLISSRGARDIQATPSEPGTNPIPKVKAVGIGELLVVKQQITRYEPAEVAHIENVLAGEAKVRTHRKLDRIEEETEWFSEEITTQERELEATERYELNKEATSTTQKDQQKGFGLSLSGKYGPTVEFSSELNLQDSSSQTDSTRNAVSYAKDVIERSRDSIVKTVREQRRVRMIREVEEVNEHRLTNSGGVHISGVYQFVDKIYTSRVFNYGLRQMFDFLVPEPASYLFHLNETPRSNVELPVPPIELNAFVADASGIDEFNYLELGARYQVEGLTPPPPMFATRRVGVSHGEGEASEEGQPRSFAAADIEIPAGYDALVGEVASVLTSDEIPTLILSVGQIMLTRGPADMTAVDLGQGTFKAYLSTDVLAFGAELGEYASGQNLTIHVFANESANYTVKVRLVFIRRSAALRQWRIKTYEKISQAYQAIYLQYRQDVEALRARTEQQAVGSGEYGSPPARNQAIVTAELKKHCLAIIRRTHDNTLSTEYTGGATTDDPPLFDIADAMADGSRIRFLETAFEWDQMQYVCYPYFWSRLERWAERFHMRNLDPVFEEFLRAGSARVVVPVRPGLEAAVSHFLVTNEVWSGEGEPTITDPLYRPIVDEIKERSGAGKGEIAVGDSWETRMPTAAIKLRKDDALPEWELRAGSDWDWSPKP